MVWRPGGHRWSDTFHEAVPLIVIFLQLKVFLQECQHGLYHNFLTLVRVQLPSSLSREEFTKQISSHKSEITLTLMNRTKDGYDLGLAVTGADLLHSADALSCLEVLSVDEEDRALSLRVEVVFQRKHPGVQSYCTPKMYILG